MHLENYAFGKLHFEKCTNLVKASLVFDAFDIGINAGVAFANERWLSFVTISHYF